MMNYSLLGISRTQSHYIDLKQNEMLKANVVADNYDEDEPEKKEPIKAKHDTSDDKSAFETERFDD